MSDQPIDIHYVLLEDWLRGREDLITRKHAKEFKRLLEIAPKMVQVAKYDVPALKKSRQRHGALAEELRRRVDTGLSEVDRLKKQQASLLESYGLIDIVKKALPDQNTPQESIIQIVQEHFDAVLDVRLNCAFHALCQGIQRAAKEVVPTALAAFATHVALISQGANNSIPQVSELFPVLSKLVELCDAPIEVEGPAVWKYVVDSCNDGAADAVDAPGLISWGVDEDAAPTIDFGDADGGIEINWGDDDGGAGNVNASIANGGDGSAAYSQVLVDAGVILTSISQLLHRAELRGALMDEVDALLAFFNETIEPTSQGDQASRDTLVPQTVVTAHKAVAKELHSSFVSVLRDPRQQELLRLRSDLQSRIVFGEGVMRLSSYAHAIVSKREDLIAQSNAAAAAAIALAPRVEESIKAAEGLQQQCEAILCGIFTPRPVYLSGDINAL